MTIAYVITRADAVGGATIHVRDLARAMLERGHRVLVLVGGVGPVTDQLADAGVPFRALKFLRRPVQPLREWRALAELISVLRQMRPDLVSAHTAKAGFIARAACARLGIPSIYTPHGWVIDDRISVGWGSVFSTAERLASRWTRAIICVCEYERQLAIRKRVGAERKLFLVHNGVRDVAAGLRADTGRGAVRICSVARLDSPKDHSTLLRALAELRSESWELDLVGEGPLERALRKQAAELGIGERVHFLGYQPNPAGTLATAQIFVLASRSEAFPRSILEAMRAGIPVVAADVGGVSEAVIPGVNGLLVPPQNPQALSSAIGRLLASAAYRQQLGDAGRQAFEARFQARTMVDKTEAIYRHVLKSKNGSRTWDML